MARQVVCVCVCTKITFLPKINVFKYIANYYNSYNQKSVNSIMVSNVIIEHYSKLHGLIIFEKRFYFKLFTVRSTTNRCLIAQNQLSFAVDFLFLNSRNNLATRLPMTTQYC